MQDIHEESLNESVKSEQSPRVVLWEIDLTVQGGERYFFCNELNEKGEAVTWQGRQYQAYPIDGSGFEMNGKGSSARPSLTVSNLFGLVTGMAEDLQSLVGATVVRRRVYARFLDAVNFVAGNPEADPEQELSDRWVVEQMSELTAMTASFVLATPTETDGALFPGRIMLANTCMWDYRGDECGYTDGALITGLTFLDPKDTTRVQGFFQHLQVRFGDGPWQDVKGMDGVGSDTGRTGE
ncbi:phage minor tail protein L [Escherichia coli]|nr:phage minor tail protein L [Escherichia coli]EFG7809025.1 phage minor tail protein L [Escherichia coli]EFH6594068.1 phage minor tail protein L [Escherichia coli]EFM5982685.1 phage minor tail protein L [Escherichia coli]EFN8624120.1 phage minor tail protein L [Escherichia coli O51]